MLRQLLLVQTRGHRRLRRMLPTIPQPHPLLRRRPLQGIRQQPRGTTPHRRPHPGKPIPPRPKRPRHLSHARPKRPRTSHRLRNKVHQTILRDMTLKTTHPTYAIEDISTEELDAIYNAILHVPLPYRRFLYRLKTQIESH